MAKCYREFTRTILYIFAVSLLIGCNERNIDAKREKFKISSNVDGLLLHFDVGQDMFCIPEVDLVDNMYSHLRPSKVRELVGIDQVFYYGSFFEAEGGISSAVRVIKGDGVVIINRKYHSGPLYNIRVALCSDVFGADKSWKGLILSYRSE